MTLADWLWLALALIGPLPLVLLGRWHRRRQSARNVSATMAYRRAKFGGFVSTKAVQDRRRVVEPVERPGD